MPIDKTLLSNVGQNLTLVQLATDGSWVAIIGAATGAGPDQATATANMLNALLANLQAEVPTLAAKSTATQAAIQQVQALGAVVPVKGP